MSKEYKFMSEIISKYHPEFTKSKDLTKYGLAHSSIFNVERLIEESLAHLGGYKFVDEEGRDFDDIDNSDSKTVTIVNNGGAQQAKVLIIKNVHTKIGSLRITIFNPFSNGIDFLYMPRKAVRYWKENDGSLSNTFGPKERIRTTWNSKQNHYNKLEEYRVSSFLELATAKD